MGSNVTKEIEELGLRLRTVEGSQRTQEYKAILEVLELLQQLSRKVDRLEEGA